MAWTIKHDAFLAELQRRCRPPPGTSLDHNVCLEVAAIAAATARGLGLTPVERIGWWHELPHAWCEVDGMVIHSRQRCSDGFELRWFHTRRGGRMMFKRTPTKDRTGAFTMLPGTLP